MLFSFITMTVTWTRKPRHKKLKCGQIQKAELWSYRISLTQKSDYVSHLKMNPGPFRTLLPDTSTRYSVLRHDTDSVLGNHSQGDLPSRWSPQSYESGRLWRKLGKFITTSTSQVKNVTLCYTATESNRIKWLNHNLESYLMH